MSIALYRVQGKVALTNLLSSEKALWAAGLLMAIGIFGIGRLYGQGEMISEIKMITYEAPKIESPKPQEPPYKAETGERGAQGGQVVASKNGTKFHYPWCPGAKQIKNENKIFFASESEAITAGFTKAANCN